MATGGALCSCQTRTVDGAFRTIRGEMLVERGRWHCVSALTCYVDGEDTPKSGSRPHGLAGATGRGADMGTLKRTVLRQ